MAVSCNFPETLYFIAARHSRLDAVALSAGAYYFYVAYYFKSLGDDGNKCRHFLATRINALDAGAGSGILSMMAARAGATSVVGVEQSAHMTDVGEECLVRATRRYTQIVRPASVPCIIICGGDCILTTSLYFNVGRFAT
eukprot:scaffold252005_cov21-Prasinocladus_malaysianus.AAC.1